MKNISVLLLTIVLGCQSSPTKTNGKVSSGVDSEPHSAGLILGFLEDDRAELANWEKGPSKTRIVRPAFVHKDGFWDSIKKVDHPLEWTIAFDGKNLGNMISKPDNSRADSINTNVHLPENRAQALPNITNPNNLFGGWLEKVRRPLVLVTKPYFTDPDQWKPTKLKDHEIQVFKKQFRLRFGETTKCDKNEIPLQAPLKYKDSEIEVHRSYRSAKNTLIASVNLRGSDNCGILGDSYVSQIFVLKSNSETDYLGQGMTLLDAGDYNSDGESEVIFFSSGYNQDGYVLFYKNFERTARVTWSYH